MRTAGAENTSDVAERKNCQPATAKRRRERIDYWKARFAPMVVKAPPPAKLKSSGTRSPTLSMPSDLPPVRFERFRSRREEAIMRFVAVVLKEMRSCRDFEALLYAIEDTLACSANGVPWEE